jgi:cell division protein FtsB
MDLPSLLRNQVKQPVDTIVHIGVGANANAAQYEGADFQRVILVEANPQACDKLRRIFSPDPRFVIQEVFVADSARQQELHCYNFDLLSGPLKWEPSDAYPRLQLEKSLTMESVAFDTFIATLGLSSSGPHTLVLDTPGQEAQLLASLNGTNLTAFDSIVLRGTTLPLPPQAEATAAAIEALQGKGYILHGNPSPETTSFPCYFLRKDAAKLQLLEELETRARLLVTKATQIHQQGEQIAALTSERETLSARVTTLESENSELVTRNQQLATERDALVAERDALAARVSTLESDNSDLVTRHTSLVTESEALRSDLAAKTTLLDVLTKGRIAQDEQMEKLLQEQNSLISERDALASRVSDLMSQVEKQEAHAKLIDEEFGKAEGQIELIKDIFLREAIR